MGPPEVGEVAVPEARWVLRSSGTFKIPGRGTGWFEGPAPAKTYWNPWEKYV